MTKEIKMMEKEIEELIEKGDLLVSSEHKIYVEEENGDYNNLNSFINSSVVNISLSDCSLNASSLNASSSDQIEVLFNNKDSANYGSQKNSSGVLIADTIAPNINFTNPTPSNGSTQANTNIFVNVTANDTASNISTFIDFDNSLVGWWRMDDLNSSGGVIDYKGCYDNETEILTRVEVDCDEVNCGDENVYCEEYDYAEIAEFDGNDGINSLTADALSLDEPDTYINNENYDLDNSININNENLINEYENKEKENATENVASKVMQFSQEYNNYNNNIYLNVDNNIAEEAPVALMIMHQPPKLDLLPRRVPGSIPHSSSDFQFNNQETKVKTLGWGASALSETSKKCYKEEWKLFKDLNNDEKVMTLDAETREKEWQLPVERQIYNNDNGEMYKIVLEDENGEESELVVSEEHKVYAREEKEYQYNNNCVGFNLSVVGSTSNPSDCKTTTPSNTLSTKSEIQTGKASSLPLTFTHALPLDIFIIPAPVLTSSSLTGLIPNSSASTFGNVVKLAPVSTSALTTFECFFSKSDSSISTNVCPIRYINSADYVKYHYLTKLRLWLLATILEKNPIDLSYYLIAEQGSEIIGTALHKLYFLQHPITIRITTFINLYTPIHLPPNKVMEGDFLETKLKKELLEEYEKIMDDALEIASAKAENIIENYNFEMDKRSKFQYEMSEEIKLEKAKTSFARAKEFVFEMRKLLENK